MAIPVLADPQFSLVRILRPYSGFETNYGGVTTGAPIMLTQVLRGTGGAPLDDLALQGQPGYAPNLMRGLPVPLGSRVVFYFPNILPNTILGDPLRYIWFVIWRLRNVHDFRVGRIPYHYPKQGEGVPDTSGATPQARVVIPAGYNSLPYPQVQPGAPGTRVQTALRTEEFTFGSDDFTVLPPLPDGTPGAFQQGLLDPGVFALRAAQPLYQMLELQALGDEVMIGVRRVPAGGNWDFTQPAGIDGDFSLLLGDADGGGTPFPDIGVYVMMGAAP